ncbi:MAG: CotH kinase family protein, partial [bacterium]
PMIGQQEGIQMQGEMPMMGQQGEQMQGDMPMMGQQGEQMQGGNQMQGDMSNNKGGMMGGMMGGMTSSSGGGGDFIYSDDNIESYADIFDNSINNTANYKDKMRVIEAIKALNDGDNYDIEDYWDVDSILRFFAGHTTVVNMDSFSAGRFTNLYVYEFNGKMNLIPWDYNESFAGAFATGVDVVNFPIDTPLINIDMSDFPLLDILVSNPEYQARYHYYLLDICDYIDNTLIGKIEDLQEKINPLIESDPTAFVTYSNYLKGAEELKSALILRSESIRGQVAGIIPSTTQAQAQNPELLVQHNINTSTLGSNSGGMGGGGNGERMQAMGGNMGGGNMQIPDLSQLGIDVEGLGLDKIQSIEDLANLPEDTINQLQSAVVGQMQGGGMPNMGGNMMGNSMASSSNSLNNQNIIIFAGSLLAMLITGVLIKKNKI